MSDISFRSVLCQTAQHFPNDQTHTASPGWIPQDSCSPALPQRPDMQELQHLEEVERRLAQKFGMVSPQGIDSAAVLREAQRRDKSLWGCFCCVLLFLRTLKLSAPINDDVKQLNRLNSLRRSLPAPHSQLTRTPATQHRVDASRFWAVLIGIDAYQSNPLRGCVSDAKLVKKSLIEDVGVPEKRIQCLLGSQIPIPSNDLFTPSRSNIVNMLYSLIDNPDIEPGDNIIIYYAGHGSSYYCSEHLSTESICQTGDCPVEALCPIDRDTIDSDEHWIPDISDRELSTLFTQISRAKGHHITFITDCCHATGFERQGRDSAIRTTRPTFHSDVNDMLRAADQRLRDLPCYRSVLSKDWEPDMGSYVVLAACRDYQYARETTGKEGYCGIFTKTLVDVLESGDWKKEVTYVGLTKLLNQSCSQTPVVAGDHKHERVWYQAP
ncbi:hypothetical protein ARMSODRAFT_1082575 [Armillaria solidipes]|uniref:Peptidase C14 caspase domain-containing protein n=1 Tax=Armillaria solidipes TaxID=1076256 RepID=A0A2H3BMD5_9AGAR|nr:hypothetical protein ARMSODRAFT_1082575 [Armillaria solidipes]